jgi:ribose/xylose/arabinose/galactoside ABC-type transport system permease subunit
MSQGTEELEAGTGPSPASPHGRRDSWLSRVLESPFLAQYGLLPLVLVVVLIVGEILAPGVLSVSNLASMTRFGVELGLLACAEMVVITAGGGGIDLSVASMAAVSQVVVALMFKDGMGMAVAIAVTLAVGLLMGAFNGLLVIGVGLPALIATIATLFAYGGLALVLSNGRNIADFPSSYLSIGQGHLLGLPVQFICIFVPVAIVLWFVTQRAKFGYELRLVGTNETAALLSGINVRRIRFSGYVLAGFLSAVVGIIDSSRFATARPTAGATDVLEAVTVAVLGGVDIFGGQGTIVGVVLATAVVTILGYSFGLATINSIIETGTIGLLLILVILGQNGLKALRTQVARRAAA